MANTLPVKSFNHRSLRWPHGMLTQGAAQAVAVAVVGVLQAVKGQAIAALEPALIDDAAEAIQAGVRVAGVVEWKSQFFGSSWAKYSLAKPGTMRLVPPAERQAALRRDYMAMNDMYFTEPATFDDVLASLADLEHRINHTGE